MHFSADLMRLLQDDLRIQEHILTSDMTLEAANRLWLSNSFWKKFQDEISEGADEACLKLFNESNELCRTFAFKPQSIQDDEVIGEVKSLWIDLIGNGPESNLHLSDILDNGGVGPGANLKARSYNFYTKMFDGPLTCTSERLYRLYRYAIMANPTYLSAEETREKRYGHQIVVGNRLSFVPKTSEVSRSICTEPTLNMYIQKGLGSVLERWLKKHFRIDLSRQPELNKQMARLGSVNGSFGTIDLSSASDSVSLKMLQEILPVELMNWLSLARSPGVVFPDNSFNELHMVSSMGNGFTFPLETLLFSTIVVACYRVLGIKPKYGPHGPSNFAVFGDDIIVRKDSYDFVTRALKLFGFRVNDQKSFNSGYFRESCGGDYFRGHDIRGVYCKSLKTSADIYSTINRLIRWSARTGVLLTGTIAALKRKVDYLPIPFHDGDGEGIKTPRPPIGLPRNRNGAVIYKALVQVPETIRIPISPEEKRWFYHHKRRREIFYNGDGILVSLVGGYIRGGRATVRKDSGKTKIRRRVTSHWLDWKGRSDYRNWIETLALSQVSVDSITRTVPTENSSVEKDWEIFFDLYN